MHPATEEILQFFRYAHLPPEQAQVAKRFSDLAHFMVGETIASGHGAEVTAGLRKLLEAKDCFVRASLD